MTAVTAGTLVDRSFPMDSLSGGVRHGLGWKLSNGTLSFFATLCSTRQHEWMLSFTVHNERIADVQYARCTVLCGM